MSMSKKKWYFYEPKQQYFSLRRSNDGRFIVAVAPFGQYHIVAHIHEYPPEVVEAMMNDPTENWKIEEIRKPFIRVKKGCSKKQKDESYEVMRYA